MAALPGSSLLAVTASGALWQASVSANASLVEPIVAMLGSVSNRPLLADFRVVVGATSDGRLATLALASAGAPEVSLYAVRSAPLRAELICSAKLPARAALLRGRVGDNSDEAEVAKLHGEVSALRLVSGGPAGTPLVVIGTEDGLLLAYTEAGCALARVLHPPPPPAAPVPDGPVTAVTALASGTRLAFAVGASAGGHSEVHFVSLRRSETSAASHVPVCRPGRGRLLALAADDAPPGVVWAGAADGAVLALMPVFPAAGRWTPGARMGSCFVHRSFKELAAPASAAPGIALAVLPGLVAAVNARGCLFVNGSALLAAGSGSGGSGDGAGGRSSSGGSASGAVADAVLFHQSWSGGVGARVSFVSLPPDDAPGGGGPRVGLALAAGGLLETHALSAQLLRTLPHYSSARAAAFSSGAGAGAGGGSDFSGVVDGLPLRALYVLALVVAAVIMFRFQASSQRRAAPLQASAHRSMHRGHSTGRRGQRAIGDEEAEDDEFDAEHDLAALSREDFGGGGVSGGRRRRRQSPPSLWQKAASLTDASALLKVLGLQVGGRFSDSAAGDTADEWLPVSRTLPSRLGQRPSPPRATTAPGGSLFRSDHLDDGLGVGFSAHRSRDGDRDDGGRGGGRDSDGGGSDSDGDNGAARFAMQEELLAMERALERAAEQARLRRRSDGAGGSAARVPAARDYLVRQAPPVKRSPAQRPASPPPPLPSVPARAAGGPTLPPVTPLLPRRVRSDSDGTSLASSDDDEGVTGGEVRFRRSGDSRNGADGLPSAAPAVPSGPAQWAAALASMPGGNYDEDTAVASQLLEQLVAGPGGSAAARRAARMRFVSPRALSPSRFADERFASAQGVHASSPQQDILSPRARAAAAHESGSSAAAAAAAVAAAARSWSRTADAGVRDPDDGVSSDEN